MPISSLRIRDYISHLVADLQQTFRRSNKGIILSLEIGYFCTLSIIICTLFIRVIEKE
jgi:hypothetical protein